MRDDAIMPQNACMLEVTLTVPGYDPVRGAVIQPEGGDVLVRHCESGIEILGDPAGLRDLARWCLVLADEQAPDGTHVISTPGQSRWPRPLCQWLSAAKTAWTSNAQRHERLTRATAGTS